MTEEESNWSLLQCQVCALRRLQVSVNPDLIKGDLVHQQHSNLSPASAVILKVPRPRGSSRKQSVDRPVYVSARGNLKQQEWVMPSAIERPSSKKLT